MGERLAGQPAALLQTEAFTIGHTGRDERIVGRVGDDGDGGAVLRRATHHGRAADVDLLDDRGLVGAGTNRIGERVQVDDDQVEGLDAELLKLGSVIGVGHVGEDAGVDVRVERLDTAVEALRESGDLAHLSDGDAEFGEALGGRAGGHHFGAGLDEGLSQYFDAFLMEDGHQSPSYRSIRVGHRAPSWLLIVWTCGKRWYAGALLRLIVPPFFVQSSVSRKQWRRQSAPAPRPCTVPWRSDVRRPARTASRRRRRI